MTTIIILLHVGYHIFVIVSGKEDYDVLKVSCKELFGEINKLIAEGEIDVDDKKIPLEFYLSGDYKVQQFSQITFCIFLSYFSWFSPSWIYHLASCSLFSCFPFNSRSFNSQVHTPLLLGSCPLSSPSAI